MKIDVLEFERKTVGLEPMSFCNFFLGMKIVKIKGIESDEYVFGIYDMLENFSGFMYFGTKYSLEDVAKKSQKLFPQKLKDLSIFIENFGKNNHYELFDQDRYLEIYEKVIIKE